MAQYFAVPKYPRNQVDKAGEQFATGPLIGDTATWVFEVINNWRDAHSFPLRNFQMLLGKRARSISQDAIVAQRIKRMESIKSKLRRFPSMELSQMQDIGGCRAVMWNVGEVRRLVDDFLVADFVHALCGEKSYIDQPKADGYRSHHLIYQFKASSKMPTDYDDLRIELQIRSRRQHAWATAVEAVGVFTRSALKSNIGSQDWLRFFALMSAEIADLEQTATVPGTPESRSGRIVELRDLAKRLRAVETLKACSATIESVGEARSYLDGYGYFLVQLDFKKGRVVLQRFHGSESQQANLAYMEAERSTSDGSKNIVLVSVNSIRALKAAYPNYFMDTEDFTNLLNSALLF